MNKLILCILLALPLLACSQTLNDPFYVSYSYLPRNSFPDQPGNNQLRFLELNASAPPIRLGGKTRWFNSAYYRNSQFGFNETADNNFNYPSTLHDIRYTAILRTELSKRWELVAVGRAMLRSDLRQSLSAKDIFPQALLLANYAVKGDQNFRIGVGLALNNDFERNAIIPIGSLFYNRKHVRIEIVYPNAHFLYKKNDNLELGLFTTVDGAISHVETGASVQDPSYLRTFQLLIGPAVSTRLYKKIFGHLKMGMAPIRSLETLDKDSRQYQTNPLISALQSSSGSASATE